MITKDFTVSHHKRNISAKLHAPMTIYIMPKY